MKKITNVFTEDQIILLNNLINNAELRDDTLLGRKIGDLDLPYEIRTLMNDIVNESFSKSLSLGSVTYVEYNNKYGIPNLPPHFDGDNIDLIFNFQFESNTEWALGLDLEVHNLLLYST